MAGITKVKMSDTSFKALLLSAILNGVFTSTELQTFLSNNGVNQVLVIPDDDSEIHQFDIDDDSSSDSEMGFNEVKFKTCLQFKDWSINYLFC